jgi:hypothetical protein
MLGTSFNAAKIIFRRRNLCYMRAKSPRNIGYVVCYLDGRAQWVLSVPFPLRFLFAGQPAVTGRVLAIVYRYKQPFRDGSTHVVLESLSCSDF